MLRVLRGVVSAQEARKLFIEEISILSTFLTPVETSLWHDCHTGPTLRKSHHGNSISWSKSFGSASLAAPSSLDRIRTWKEPSVACGCRFMSGGSKEPSPHQSTSDPKDNASVDSSSSQASGRYEREIETMRLKEFIPEKMQHRAESLKGVARKSGEQKGDPPNSPSIVHSNSLLWEDSVLGGIVRSFAAVGSWIQSFLVRRSLDKDFDLHDFMEGCRDASFMVNQLFGECAWEALEKMVSSRLLMIFKDVTEEFEQKGLKFSLTTEHIRNSYIQSVHVCDEALMTRFDETLSTKSPHNIVEENCENRLWVMVGVRILSNERMKVWKSDGGLISDVLSQRTDLWIFARGPFHHIPMLREESNDLQWKLLSVG